MFAEEEDIELLTSECEVRKEISVPVYDENKGEEHIISGQSLEHSESEHKVKTMSSSCGTSPPPQSASTQVNMEPVK